MKSVALADTPIFKMADFTPAYKNILRFEGGYVNDKADRGGETFAGVARKSNPKWEGWKAIDKIKGQMNFTGANKAEVKKLNDILFFNTPLMKSHYNLTKKNYWDAVRGDEIRSQKIADFVFDFFWGSGYNAIKILQAAIAQVKGKGISGTVDEKTLQLMNSLAEDDLLGLMYDARKRFYYKIVEKDGTQAKFLKGWLKRLETFGSGVKVAVQENSGKIGLFALAAVGAAIAILSSRKNKAA